MDCKISKNFANTQEKREKMHFFALFLRKYLVNSKKSSTFAAAFEKKADFAEIAQLVEHDLAKVGVAGSSPVFRSKGKSNVQNSGSAFFSENY